LWNQIFENNTNCNLTEEDSGAIITDPKTFSITNMFKEEYNNNNVSLTIYVRDKGGGVASLQPKEYTTAAERPKLIITYTPYIDIISPTPSQIFTEDSPTTVFNITNNTAYDVCYAELDSATNFTVPL